MDLKKYKLGDIADIINGATPSTSCEDNYDGEIVWITPKDLSEQKAKYVERGSRNITQKGFNSCSAQMIPAYNILMSSRAPIGLLAINKAECCTNQGFKNIVVDRSICDVDFLYYYLKYHIKEIEALGSGTTFKEVSKTSLQQFEITIPSLDVQKHIASILADIDQKIALNREINDNLEAMAKQLYDYWFVQFDFPNEEGKPYKSSGGKMVWNDKLKREIPEGWEVKSINDLSTICRGVSYKPSDLQDNGVLILRGNNIENNRIIYDNNTAFLSPNLISTEQKIKRHDIIITMSSGSKEHIGKCAMFQLDSEHSFGAFLSKITPNKDCPHFIFLFLSSTYFKQKIKSVCNGTGINNLTNQTFDEVKFAYPMPNTLKLFERRIQSIFDTIGNNDAENEVLTKQRDELLPLLMNGQVLVNYHLSDD